MQKNQAVLYYHLIYKQILEKVFCVAFLEIPKKKFLWTGLVTTVTRVTKVTRVIRLRCLSSYLEWVSHQDLRKIACVGCFRYFVFVFVVVFVFFVFVFPHDFWIAFIISFQNMYGYRGLWSIRAEIMSENGLVCLRGFGEFWCWWWRRLFTPSLHLKSPQKQSLSHYLLKNQNKATFPICVTRHPFCNVSRWNICFDRKQKWTWQSNFCWSSLRCCLTPSLLHDASLLYPSLHLASHHSAIHHHPYRLPSWKIVKPLHRWKNSSNPLCFGSGYKYERYCHKLASFNKQCEQKQTSTTSHSLYYLHQLRYNVTILIALLTFMW